MSPDTLAKIGDYELKEKLGQGGYGAVYRARDPIGRDVAIKVLTSFGDDNNTIEGFKKEATTLARLSHRNIVTVYQFGVDNGRPYLAMEYLQGQPLSAIIKAHREMHLVEKLDIIIQASEGLRHAHENKVIHRDIKPHNLMVVENSVVKLIDFGIAQGDNSKSQSRQEIAGSLPYMSPEHFVQKRTPWCDIFSMGVVLYELLSGGQVPYASDRDDLP
ncbi:MAG TPA: serine/threonine-protein kinase, partial [Terriglobales bacterium]|nr:serine/threonine-protein kinase [Terriglobales bacterium]